MLASCHWKTHTAPSVTEVSLHKLPIYMPLHSHLVNHTHTWSTDNHLLIHTWQQVQLCTVCHSTTASVIPRSTTANHSLYHCQMVTCLLPHSPSELQVRMRLEERRKKIEEEKQKMETVMSKQREKVTPSYNCTFTTAHASPQGGPRGLSEGCCQGYQEVRSSGSRRQVHLQYMKYLHLQYLNLHYLYLQHRKYLQLQYIK